MKGQSKGMSKPSTNKKPLGITKVLAIIALQGGEAGMKAAYQRAALLTNNYLPPIPGHRNINQRQRRKLARQTGIYA